MNLFRAITAAVISLAISSAVHAEDLKVGLSAEMQSVTVETPDGPIEIKRVQDMDNKLTGDFAQTSRACPPFCIQPITPAEGVTTIGELELIELLKAPDVMVTDSRTVNWFKKGSIPGAINLPYDQVVDRLDELGCEADFEGWDCSQAIKIALFCNGFWCGQSPTAIRLMVSEGYPADRIFYYRGGIQSWQILGLTMTAPAEG